MANAVSARATGWREGEVLVQFDPGADASARSRALQAVGGGIDRDLAAHGGPFEAAGPLARVALGRGIDVDRAIEILSKLPGVKLVERDWRVDTFAVSNDPAYTGGSTWGLYGDQTTPTNQFGSQAGEAWGAGFTGSSKTVVGVVDTGVD